MSSPFTLHNTYEYAIINYVLFYIDIEMPYYILYTSYERKTTMKKKEPTSTFDVHKDSELEALAKAYVQAAHKRKMTMTDSSKIIAQIWREDITEPQKAQKLITMPLKETEDQMVFRTKAEKMIEEYPEFVCNFAKMDIATRKQFSIEIICAIHKVFQEKDRIQSNTLVYYIRDYFSQILKNSEYNNTTIISHFKQHIFNTLELYFVFNTTNYSGIGCFGNVDTAFRPFYQENIHRVQLPFCNIDHLLEPYLKEKEYAVRRSQTSTAIIRLIWFVETFF